MPPGIADPALLGLLGDILRPDPAPVGPMRLRLMQPGFSWQALVDLAAGQDVLAPLVLALSTRGLLPPVPRSAAHGNDSHVTNRLGDSHRRHLARRQQEKAQLDRVLSALNRAGIVPLILKGGRYLAVPHAPWCEARTLRDIDVLVRAGDAGRAVAALQADGYRPAGAYMDNYHHLPDLARDGEPLAVEIHTEALAAAAQAIMTTGSVWASAVGTAAGTAFVLPARWQALHCLLHHQVSDRGYRRQTLAVKALWEWTMLAGEFAPADWAAVSTHMRRAGAADVLGSWVAQSRRLFAAAVPPVVEISAAAAANAEATFRSASRPHWLRRARFVADQLRYSFARETLGRRYGKAASGVSIGDAVAWLAHLLRRHRGQTMKRLTGRKDRLS